MENRLDDNSKKARGARKRREDLPIDAIEQEYLNGATTYFLGEKYGVDHSTISKWMRSLGHFRGRGNGLSRNLTCSVCGQLFTTTRSNEIYCSECRKQLERNNEYRHRARRYGVEYDPSITLQSALSRLGMTCALCGGECDQSDRTSQYVGAKYPTIDHIQPMSMGGSHTWGNVQIAHMLCNSKKGVQDWSLTKEFSYA